MATIYDLTSSIPSASSLVTGDILNCPYSGTYKSITLPKGTYKLECWGAQGGGDSSSPGGNGGYSVGIITLSAQQNVYLYTGGAGGNAIAGFNGGGSVPSSASYVSGGGGGASDIRIGQDSLYARVIVAGGGGGGENEVTGYYGGAGGGSSGINGLGYGSYGAGTGGSQTAGGSNAYGGINNTGMSFSTSSFGQGASITIASSSGSGFIGGAGGGGWYGGGAGGAASGGGGGSGYVYTSSTASSYPSGCLLGSSYYLTSASTTAGNTSFTSTSGGTETGHAGNGYIRITVQSIVNWAYSTVSITTPTYDKKTTSTWDLTPSTCRYFSFTPTISGEVIFYSNSSMDTFGYLTTSIASLDNNGRPSNYLISNDEDAKKYGGSGNNFGICYKVTAGTTYYIYVKPYSATTVSSSVSLTYYMAHPDARIFVKIDSSTWKQITN